jgi:hypothetical protein
MKPPKWLGEVLDSVCDRPAPAGRSGSSRGLRQADPSLTDTPGDPQEWEEEIEDVSGKAK